jgi:hypothetical protein
MSGNGERMRARHTSQHNVFWVFWLRVRQSAKGSAPKYGTGAVIAAALSTGPPEYHVP